MLTAFLLASIRSFGKSEIQNCSEVNDIQQMIDDITAGHILYKCYCENPEKYATLATESQNKILIETCDQDVFYDFITKSMLIALIAALVQQSSQSAL